jgi:hypothetical protein
MARDLFYSVHEKILFLVAGYTDNTDNVKSIVSMLENNAKHMQRISGGIKEINTTYIEKSRRYKYMRVFYCKTDNPPENAFRIGDTCKEDDPNKWTMMKWLTD